MNDMTSPTLQDLLPDMNVKSSFGSFAGAEAIPALLDALSKAQGQFLTVRKNCTGHVVPKDTTKASFEFKYADLYSYTESTKEALSAHGLSITSIPVATGGSTALRMFVMHKDGGFLCGELAFPFIKEGFVSQVLMAVGGAMQFMRRYLYKALLNLSDEGEERIEDEGMDGVTAAMPTSRSMVHDGMAKAKDISELSGIMRRLSASEKVTYSPYFNKRQAELSGEG